MNDSEGGLLQGPPGRLLVWLITVGWLVLMWVALWGDASPGTIIAGAAVGALCLASAKLPRVRVRLRFRPLRMLLLLSRIGYDLFSSSVRVAWAILWRPSRVRGAIVAVSMRTESDLLLAMIAGALSLVTGSLVIEVNREDGVLYVHGVPIDSLDAVERLRAQVERTEELFVRALGTEEEIAAFWRADSENGDGGGSGDAGPAKETR